MRVTREEYRSIFDTVASSPVFKLLEETRLEVDAAENDLRVVQGTIEDGAGECRTGVFRHSAMGRLDGHECGALSMQTNQTRTPSPIIGESHLPCRWHFVIIA